MPRSIYDKSIKELFKDLMRELGISRGAVVSRKDIQDWFHQKYPAISDGAISAHLVLLTTNSRGRVNHRVDPGGKDDLLFKINRTDFRAYDPANDPKPIYKNTPDTETIRREEDLRRDENRDKRMNDILHELQQLLESIKSLPKNTDLYTYINELHRQGYIPDRIVALMHAIRKMRNAFVKQRIKLTATEFAAVEANWSAVREWARDLRLLRP